jgi:hypothetical protein
MRPGDPECIVGAFEVLYLVGGSGGRYRCQWCRAEAYTHGVEFPHGVDCPTRTLRKQADHLAALTHAVEALRGEMEQLHDAMAQQSAMTTSLQVQERAYCDGKGAAARYAAGKLAAILKEWEGQQ